MTALTISPKNLTDDLPSEVKIGPIIFEVAQEPCPTVEDAEGNKIPVYGKISFKEEKIVIDSELKPATKWQCLLHECWHAILETLGMAGNAEEEGQVDAFAYALLGFLLDNGFMSREFLAPETSKFFSMPTYPHTMEKRA